MRGVPQLGDRRPAYRWLQRVRRARLALRRSVISEDGLPGRRGVCEPRGEVVTPPSRTSRPRRAGGPPGAALLLSSQWPEEVVGDVASDVPSEVRTFQVGVAE